MALRDLDYDSLVALSKLWSGSPVSFAELLLEPEQMLPWRLLSTVVRHDESMSMKYYRSTRMIQAIRLAKGIAQ